MSGLSDQAIERLRRALDLPELEGTRYRLLGPLGRGGMGAVFLVHDRELDREVAMKVLDLPETSPELSARLLRESRILARLEHPGIVPVHDVGELPDGRIYYTMKRVEGRRLDEHAAEAALPERLRAFGRVCDAVAFAHERGVVHRDLKPANVMVGRFGEVLVLDWGVAKALDAAESTAPSRMEPGAATAHGAIVGTPGYMAPEQQRAEGDVDARSDVYALGVMLAELVTAGGPPPLLAIAARARSADRESRYPSASALAADVGRWLDGLAVTAYRESALSRLGRHARRHRTAIALIAAYLVMRVALLLVTGR